MNIIAIVNQKGGVAKTTSSINLGACLVELGKKVLLVDTDPQHNLTSGIGFEGEGKTIYECLVEELPVENVIYNTKIENLDIIPSNLDLANADIALSNVFGKETLLKDAFSKSELDYDYVLIDCNPSLGIMTVNALTVADDVIIPLEPGIFGLEGIEQLVKVIQLVKRKLNNKLNIKGVLLTRVDSRTRIAKEVLEQLESIFKDKVFKTVIHQNVKVSEAQAHQLPINAFDKKSKGYAEYKEVAKELVVRG